MPDIPTGAVVSAAQAVSRFKPWAAIKRHDRLVRQEYEDLLTFARDGLQEEARALDAARNELAASGMLRSGAFRARLMRVREDWAKKWRDFKRTSDRRIEEMQEAEGLTVRAWRKLSRRPWPVNAGAVELGGLVRPRAPESAVPRYASFSMSDRTPVVDQDPFREGTPRSTRSAATCFHVPPRARSSNASATAGACSFRTSLPRIARCFLAFQPTTSYS